MAARALRAAIVGASTLLGKELAEQLTEATGAVWDLTLFDAEDASGQMSAAGDEALVIQALAPGSFERMDIVFFASDAATVGTHWKEAQASGAGVVDLTGTLVKEAGAVVLAPNVAPAKIDLSTTLVVPAGAASVMLAAMAVRLKERFGSAMLAATVLQPASEWGKAGLDEMHQQTVGLLSFQAVPKDVFDEQVAFNLTTEVGEDAKGSLTTISANIEREFALLAEGCQLALQLVQAPVFNGYTASVFVATDNDVSTEDVRTVLTGGPLHVVPDDEAAPSNLTASGQKQVLLRVKKAGGGFWLWAAADNLAFAAENAVACATELVRLRPAGTVQ